MSTIHYGERLTSLRRLLTWGVLVGENLAFLRTSLMDDSLKIANTVAITNCSEGKESMKSIN